MLMIKVMIITAEGGGVIQIMGIILKILLQLLPCLNLLESILVTYKKSWICVYFYPYF